MTDDTDNGTLQRVTDVSSGSAAVARQRGLLAGLARNAPGLAWVASTAAVAIVAARWVPLIGAPVLAIVLGAAARAALGPGEHAAPGLRLASTVVLQGAIVLLGAGIGLTQVFHTGVDSLPVMLGSLAVALAGASLIGRLLGVERNLRMLIGVGTGICGASAIAAVSAVVDAKRSDIAYAVATIFAFNVVGVISFPLLGHLLGLSDEAFGLWAGTAINDTSSVVAAAASYGDVATDHAVIVKLTRATLIVPIVLVLVAARVHQTRNARANMRIHRLVPWFIVLFLLATAANTAGLVPHAVHGVLSSTAVLLITAALAAIGLSADPGTLRRAGFRPLLLGALVWLIVVATTLLLLAAGHRL